jgi:hypothetical protein
VEIPDKSPSPMSPHVASPMKRYSPEELNEVYRRVAGISASAGLWVPVPQPSTGRSSGPAMGMYLRYSDVEPQSRALDQRYWELLRQVPVVNSVGALAFINNKLSRILGSPNGDASVHLDLAERLFRPDLRKRIADYRPGATAFSAVFTRTGCLQLIRHLMLYGGDSMEDRRADAHTLGELALLGNDFLRPNWTPAADLPSALEVALQCVPGWDVDNPRELAYAMARMFTILTDILPSDDPETAKLCSNAGVDASAVMVDGLSLVDFMSVVFGIYSFALDVARRDAFAAVFDYRRVFERAGFPQHLIEGFMASRSLTLAEFAERLGHGRQGSRASFDDELARRQFLLDGLNVFRQFPLLKLPDERAIILDVQSLVDLLSAGVYWNIFDNLPRERREAFKQLWGHLFEVYVARSLNYFYPPACGILSTDVRYEGGQIDALLDFGPEVIVFEVKSSLLTERAKRGGSSSEFEADLSSGAKIISQIGLNRVVPLRQ